jgi:hypothetical protein
MLGDTVEINNHVQQALILPGQLDSFQCNLLTVENVQVYFILCVFSVFLHLQMAQMEIRFMVWSIGHYTVVYRSGGRQMH